MVYGVPRSIILCPVLFIIYTVTLQYMLNFYNISNHFNADETRMYFFLGSVSKLYTVLNAVQTLIWK